MIISVRPTLRVIPSIYNRHSGCFYSNVRPTEHSAIPLSFPPLSPATAMFGPGTTRHRAATPSKNVRPAVSAGTPEEEELPRTLAPLGATPTDNPWVANTWRRDGTNGGTAYYEQQRGGYRLYSLSPRHHVHGMEVL